MEVENIDTTNKDSNATRFWAGVGFKVREGIKMHQRTGQLRKGPDSWRNVTEHCLVQVARSEVLGRLIGLPENLMEDIRMGAMLHDFDKKQEITVTREANRRGDSPLFTVRIAHLRDDVLLESYGFNDNVRRLASASGIDAPQLVEAQSILDKKSLSDEDLAWLVVHYVDDCSIGSDWIQQGEKGKNIIDYRMEQNKTKVDYVKISQEISQGLVGHPKLGNMNLYDAGAFVSHQIEQRFAQRIKEKTGEDIDPLAIPQLVDQKIKESIEMLPNYS